MAVQLPLNRDLAFTYGAIEDVAPGIRRVMCNNPGPFTLYGTATFILGQGRVAVVDPGPDDPAHIEAILKGLTGETVSHILITHTHIDHSPGARLLKEKTGAETWGFGPHGFGRLKTGDAPAEGGDMDFVPDHRLADGEVVSGRGWDAEAVHTPGHASNHLCFALKGTDILLSGDMVMGWSTTVVSPPDGDMADYMASLKKIEARGEVHYIPTHGPPVPDARPLVKALYAHRQEREQQILAALGAGHRTIPSMVPVIYADVDPKLHGPAGRSTLAAMVNLVATGRVAVAGGGEVALDAEYEAVG